MSSDDVDLDQIGSLQLECLRAFVGESGWIPTAVVADELETGTERISDQLRRLSKRGVLERRINPQNPKGYLYRLTDAGRDAIEPCDLCERVYSSTESALVCCSHRFDDEGPGAGLTSITGPAPGMVDAHNGGEQR